MAKAVADKSVEAHAAGAEEGHVVDKAIVERLDVTIRKNLEGAIGTHRDIEVPGQSVSAAAGDDAKRRLSVNQASRHLVDRAVATHSHSDVGPLLNSSCHELRCMTFVLSLADGPFKAVAVEVLRDAVDDVLLVRSARNGVDDEYYLGPFLHISRCKDTKMIRD